MPRRLASTLLPLLVAALGCGGGELDAAVAAPAVTAPVVRARLSFERDAGFFAAPFPIAHRVRPEGSLRVADFPNPTSNTTLARLLALLEETRSGFSTTGAVFVPFDGAINPTLPAPPKTREPDSPVFLVNVTPGSDERGARVPLELSWKAAPETYSPSNLLVALPFPGFVLTPRSTYALVVRRALGDAAGRPLGVAEGFAQLADGRAPAGDHGAEALSAYAPLFGWLGESGIPADTLAVATVFTTGDPLTETLTARDHVALRPAPPVEAPVKKEEYDGYCVVAGTTRLPVFQRGPKPYRQPGTGHLVLDANGAPVLQEEDTIEILFTVPKRPMKPGGFPLLVYAAGGGGKARQVIDRTRESEDPDAKLGPRGMGPARTLAHRGIGAVGFAAPLAWERNPTGDPGVFDFWNVDNLAAFRDVLRQGALDITTIVRIAQTVAFEPALCPGADTGGLPIRYDPGRVLFHGHSTGSTIGSLALPLEPDLGAGLLSGAGGSWLYQLTMKEAPANMGKLVRSLLSYDGEDDADRFDPVLTLFQTYMEPVEVMAWGARTVRRPLPGRSPKNLLLVEGVIDTYHFPRMVSAYGMSAGLDLATPLVEPTAEPEYAMSGGKPLALPARGNIAVGAPPKLFTALTLQHAQRPGVNGHYVPFEWDDVKHQTSCFLASFVEDGVATLPQPKDDALAACD